MASLATLSALHTSIGLPAAYASYIDMFSTLVNQFKAALYPAPDHARFIYRVIFTTFSSIHNMISTSPLEKEIVLIIAPIFDATTEGGLVSAMVRYVVNSRVFDQTISHFRRLMQQYM